MYENNINFFFIVIPFFEKFENSGLIECAVWPNFLKKLKNIRTMKNCMMCVSETMRKSISKIYRINFCFHIRLFCIVDYISDEFSKL